MRRSIRKGHSEELLQTNDLRQVRVTEVDCREWRNGRMIFHGVEKLAVSCSMFRKAHINTNRRVGKFKNFYFYDLLDGVL